VANFRTMMTKEMVMRIQQRNLKGQIKSISLGRMP
jgi:hypothetical protein